MHQIMKNCTVLLVFFLSLSVVVNGQDFQAYDQGIANFKAGEYAKVVEQFSALISNEKNKRLIEDLYFYRGQANFHTGNYAEAAADLNESLKLNHFNKAVIFLYLARCSASQGKTADAESFYDQGLAATSTNKKAKARILADRAAFYSSTGRKELADNDLSEAQQLDPSINLAPHTASQPAAKAEEKKPTQVIIRGNSAAVKNEPGNEQKPPGVQNTGRPVENPPAAETRPSQASIVAALAEAYKDEKRYALVIGNGNYPREIGVLKNPVNDATDVATELRKSNFDVNLVTNATYVQMREAMRRFQEKLSQGPKDQTVGLFYYAGHGVQFQDENYLVPVDAAVNFEDDIVRMCFPVQRMVLNNMENTNSRMNIVILDACRNNPFPAANRSVSQGLAEMKRARGSFIAYATAPGSVASDGTGRNGLYTQELLKALRKPGLTIEQVFKEVRMNVLKLSGEKQFTWDSSNIVGEFFFKF